MAVKQFSAEASLHLYSSLPTVLTPGDVYNASRDPRLRQAILGCNIYLITCRARIYIQPDTARMEDGLIKGAFAVMREAGWASVPFEYTLPEGISQFIDDQAEVYTAESGTLLMLVLQGKRFPLHVHVLVSEATSALMHSDRDLHVLYVGQGIGRTRSRTAGDRLRRHETFQMILADFHTYHPDQEILLLLYRFENHRNLISNGGDLSLEPIATPERDTQHFNKIMNARLDRTKRVALAEAGLINYFKPFYNILFKGTDLSNSPKLKTLKSALDAGLAGLSIEICTANLNSRLKSEVQSADSETYETAVELENLHAKHDGQIDGAREDIWLMKHSHCITHPLTNREERDTFLHGMRWLHDEERHRNF